MVGGLLNVRLQLSDWRLENILKDDVTGWWGDFDRAWQAPGEHPEESGEFRSHDISAQQTHAILNWSLYS